MKKIIDKKLRILGLWENVRVVENHGAKVIDVLMNHNNNNKKTVCGDDDCLVGQNPKGGNCRTNDVIYQITCGLCGDIYIYRRNFTEHTNAL